MANGEELKHYRTKIMSTLLNDAQICSLILNRNIVDTDDADMQDELRDKYILRFAFSPDVQTEEKTYIAFELSSKKQSIERLYKDMYLTFYIFSHKGVIVHPSTNYLRTDLIDERIQYLFNENADFGLGLMRCIDDKPLKNGENHYGRMLVFATKELSKNMCGS